MPIAARLFCLLMVCCLVAGSISANDTTYFYFKKDYETTSADSAVFVLKMYKTGTGWFGKEFNVKSGRLKSEGAYATNDFKQPRGLFKVYSDNGNLHQENVWGDSTVISRTYYYKSGKKQSYIMYGSNGVAEQHGWDEGGNEIKNYIVEKPAAFKGGKAGYQKYLEKHLNANVAVDAGAPAGLYQVSLRFVVDQNGYVTNVKALSVPPQCKPCASEAVQVLSSMPTWEPAIENNQPVKSNMLQYVNFVVEEGGTKKKKQ